MLWIGESIQKYIDKGYEYRGKRETFLVDLKDLPLKSNKKVRVICDYCGEEFLKKYNVYNDGHKIINKDCCSNPKCTRQKVKESNLITYGVSSTSSLSEVKDKIKQTNLEKYGVEYVGQAEFVKEKMKQTNLEKYGVEYASQSQEIKDKMKQTCFEKYGVENTSQLDWVKNKMKQTNLERYGKEYYSQTDEYIEKINNTCLEKYGAEWYFTSEDFQEKRKDFDIDYEKIVEKCKQTCVERYGVESPFESEIVKEKIKQTCLEKYGVPYAIMNEDVFCKMLDSKTNNQTNRTSKQEQKCCSLIKQVFGEEYCQPSFRESKYTLDCKLEKDGIKVDIEYDGWYWHKQNQDYDKDRNDYMLNKGYNVIRIISNGKMPTKTQLLNAFNSFVKDYTQIIYIDLVN